MNKSLRCNKMFNKNQTLLPCECSRYPTPTCTKTMLDENKLRSCH